MPSAALLGGAVGSDRRLSYGRRWQWASAGALAGIALLAVVPILLHKTGRVAVTPPVAPPTPLIAKSEPVPGTTPQEHEQVRGSQSFHLLPTMIMPQPESVVATGTPEFSWESIPKSRGYEVLVVGPDGDPVWKGETKNSALQIPPNAALRAGTYFVWVKVSLEDGRFAKSTPVHFRVKR